MSTFHRVNIAKIIDPIAFDGVQFSQMADIHTTSFEVAQEYAMNKAEAIIRYCKENGWKPNVDK